MLQQAYGDGYLSRTPCLFQIGQNVLRRRLQIWTAFHVIGRRSRWESACCDSSKCSTWWDSQKRVLPKGPEAFEGGSAKKEAWGVDKQHLDVAPWQCTCSRITSYPWIFDETWDDCCPPAALLSRFGPCGIFLVPEVEIRTKRSPISDCRGDRRNFDMGPSRHPAKHLPGRVPELEKSWKRCIKSGEKYFEGDNFD